jgi:hypothetical protein
MVGRALTYLVLYSTLGMVVCLHWKSKSVVGRALILLYPASLELRCALTGSSGS